MLKKYLFFIMMVGLMFIFRSWDRVDIETRGYVLGIAIDEYPPMPYGQNNPGSQEASEEEKRKFESMELDINRPRYAMTIQFPIIKKATMTAASVGGGNSQGSKTWQLTQAGDSFVDMNEEITSRTDLIPYYEHLQSIIISDAVARKGLHDILDFFVRDPEMRRRVKVFISKGEAKRILDVIPKIEDYSAIYLSRLPLNAKVNSRILHETDLGELLISLHSDQDFVLPSVNATKDEIKDCGCAIFKNDRMVGWGDEIDTEVIKLIRDKSLGGIITATSPNDEDGIISLKITNVKTKITPVPQDSGYSFNIDVQIKGNLAEITNQEIHGILTEDFLKKSEMNFSMAVEERCRKVIRKIQEEYGADIFHLNTVLKAEKPAYWKRVKDQWRDIFPTVKTNVHVGIMIRQIGNSR
jgi:Ger(x)C family germination protein